MTRPTTKEKIRKYISDNPPAWIEQSGNYDINKDWLDKSALIAIKILRTLRIQSITQKQLAESIGISPQYINKVVKGHENLSLETICKIEKSLGISLISVPSYEISQVIIDSFLPALALISRNNATPIVSEKSAYKVESNYQPQEELAA